MLQKKISVATVYGAIDKSKIPAKGHLPIMRVRGQVSGMKPGKTDKGDYVKFTGLFRATNLETGVTVDAANCFLPGMLTDMVHAQLEASENGVVEFGFDVGVKANTKAAVGYEYVATPITEGGVNPLDALDQKLPALPGPAAEAGGKKGK